MRKKGISKIEFLFSVFVFSLVLLSLSNFISERMMETFYDMSSQVAKIRCEKIADILVKESGIPENWEKSGSFPVRLGLASGLYNLSQDKLNELANNCTLFEKAFEIYGYRLRVINLTDNSIILNCGSYGNLRARCERSVEINGYKGKVILEIWW